MFKYFVLVVCVAQCALSMPQEPSIADNIQKAFATVQQQTQKAVSDLNSKFLEFVGVKSNEEFVNNAYTETQKYVQQVKTLADSINTQALAQQDQIHTQVGTIAKQLSESASRFLANNDTAKADEIQKTFNSVLDSANSLQQTVKEQGSKVQSNVEENINKIFENTLEASKTIAQRIDTTVAQPKTT